MVVYYLKLQKLATLLGEQFTMEKFQKKFLLTIYILREITTFR